MGIPKPSKNTIIAAVSNFSTAYNLVVISASKVLIKNQYCFSGDSGSGDGSGSGSGSGDSSKPSACGANSDCSTAIDLASTACLVGAIIGQLTFGYVGDVLGRAKALQLTMALSILGAFLSAFAVPLNADAPFTIFHFLSIIGPQHIAIDRT